MSQVAAHHGVALPVAEAPTSFDFSGPVADGSLAGQYAPGIVAAVALATKLAHDARVSPQVASGALVPADAPVDRFVTDAQRALLLERARNLLGAPLAPQQAGYASHVDGAEARPAATSTTPGNGVAVCFFGAVVAIVVRRVAPQFTGDRAAVPAEHAGRRGGRMAAHLLCGNQVSFFLGELVIQHGCNPFPGRMRKQPVSPLPPSVQKLLHLLCESAAPNPSVNRTRRFMPSCLRTSAQRAGYLNVGRHQHDPCVVLAYLLTSPCGVWDRVFP